MNKTDNNTWKYSLQPLRLYDNNQPDGYRESLDSWIDNNLEAINWIADNVDHVNKCLKNNTKV